MFKKGQIVHNGFNQKLIITGVYKKFITAKLIRETGEGFEIYSRKGEFICRSFFPPEEVILFLKVKSRLVMNALTLHAA